MIRLLLHDCDLLDFGAPVAFVRQGRFARDDGLLDWLISKTVSSLLQLFDLLNASMAEVSNLLLVHFLYLDGLEVADLYEILEVTR